MNNALDDTPFDLAIIGGGAGGALAAMHALRLAKAPVRIALIEAAATLAQGVAYATRYDEHLLNVPVRGMSAFDDAPGDFLDYLADDDGIADRDALAQRFVERRRYGEYLRERLAQARQASAAELVVIQARAVALDENDGLQTLALDDGRQLRTRASVLAVGNAPRPLPAPGADALPAAQRLQAWDFDAVRGLPADAEVCIVGAGLSMADTVLSLLRSGHDGRIHVLSRHALLPLAHAQRPGAAGFDVDSLLALGLRARLRALRAHVRDAQAAGLPWQAVFERLRPHGQALWRSLSDADQRRFLRHAVRHWDVHRHRIAPQVHAQLQALLDSGQLRLHRGRLQGVVAGAGGRLRVDCRRSDGGAETFDADAIVNATGVENRAAAMRNPLLEDLLRRGLARPGPHDLGIDTDTHGRVLDAAGQAQPRLLALGSLRIGNLWESTAVPELRGQAEAAARALLALVDRDRSQDSPPS